MDYRVMTLHLRRDGRLIARAMWGRDGHYATLDEAMDQARWLYSLGYRHLWIQAGGRQGAVKQ